MTDVAPSFEYLYELGKGEVQATRSDLKFRDGDVTEAFMRAGAAMFDAVLGHNAKRQRAMYFTTSQGDDKDTIIRDRLGVARLIGTPAKGQLSFVRTGGGAGGTLAAGTEFTLPLLPDGSTQSYTLDVDVTFASGAFSATLVNASCSVVGTEGNRTGNSTVLTPTAAIFDSTIVCTNPDGMAGGTVSETDEDYTARAVKTWRDQRRGTLDAIEAGALTVAGVTVARAVDDIDTGITTLFVSDSDGNSNWRMVYDVRVALVAWAAAGSYIHVVGGQRASLTLTISLDEYAASFDPGAAETMLHDSVVNRCNLLRVGQDFTLDSLKSSVIAPFPEDITKVSIVAAAVNGVSVDPTRDIAAMSKLIRIESLTILDGKAR